MSFEIKSKLSDKKAEAINRLVNLNSPNLSDYQRQQGIIQGLNIAIRICDEMMKEELEDA